MKKRTMKVSSRIKFLAAFFAVSCLMTFFQSLSVYKLSDSGLVAGDMITVTAEVPANPYNLAADQLQRKELELSEKEAKLRQQERELAERRLFESERLNYFFVLSLALLVLIALNFYLDWRRGRSGPSLAS